MCVTLKDFWTSSYSVIVTCFVSSGVCLWSESVFKYILIMCAELEWTFKVLIVERSCLRLKRCMKCAYARPSSHLFIFRLWYGGLWRVLRGQCFSCQWQPQSLCSWVDSACFTPSSGFQVRKRVRVSNKMRNYNALLILRSARVWIHYLYKL